MIALGHSAGERHQAHAPPSSLRDALAGMAGGGLSELPEPGPRSTRRGTLSRAVEQAVLPRLMLTRGIASGRPEADAPHLDSPLTADVVRLCALLVVDDRAGAIALVATLRDGGLPLDRVCLDLLAPAARWLGEAWDSDRCDFATVSLATMRLQHMVRDFGPDFTGQVRPQSRPRRILLLVAPGEQHGFGRDMLAGFFRHAGWDVSDPNPAGPADLNGLLRRDAFQVIGISAASDARLDAVAGCIRTIRHSPRNQGAGIMVGGPVFLARPDAVALVGADATATDGRHAILQAERMLSLMSQCA